MDWQTILTNTSLRTFEQLCFLVPEASDDASDGWSATVVARVGFVGGKEQNPCGDGALYVGMDGALAQAVADSMLGVEGAAPADVQDAVGELVNVMIGDLFHQGAPKSGNQLGAPESNISWPSAEAAISKFGVDFDCGRAEIWLAKH